GGGVGRDVVVCRPQEATAVVVGSARSSGRPDTGVCLWSPGGPSGAASQSLTRALRDSPLLHRRLGCLAPALGPTRAWGHQTGDATTGAETSHAAHLDQTLSEKNDLLLKIHSDARSPYWSLH